MNNTLNILNILNDKIYIRNGKLESNGVIYNPDDNRIDISLSHRLYHYTLMYSKLNGKKVLYIIDGNWIHSDPIQINDIFDESEDVLFALIYRNILCIFTSDYNLIISSISQGVRINPIKCDLSAHHNSFRMMEFRDLFEYNYFSYMCVTITSDHNHSITYFCKNKREKKLEISSKNHIDYLVQIGCNIRLYMGENRVHNELLTMTHNSLCYKIGRLSLLGEINTIISILSRDKILHIYIHIVEIKHLK